MITVYSGINTRYKGLSTDAKPTNARNGDKFTEMDTSKVYRFNGSAKMWIQQATSGPTLITKTITENGTYYASEDGANGYSTVIVAIPYANGEEF